LYFFEKKLKKYKHEVFLGSESYRGIRNTWTRVTQLMIDADLVFIFLENTGGCLMEHTITHCYTPFLPKTINLIKKGTYLTGMITKGTLLKNGCRYNHYKDSNELNDLIERYVDDHQKLLRFKPPKTIKIS
jgi:hypothetical protein